MKSVVVDSLKLASQYCLGLDIHCDVCVHDFVLEGGDDVLVAKEPHLDKKLPGRVEVFIAELTSVNELVEDIEYINPFVGQCKLALYSLLERAVECASEVV